MLLASENADMYLRFQQDFDMNAVGYIVNKLNNELNITVHVYNYALNV